MRGRGSPAALPIRETHARAATGVAPRGSPGGMKNVFGRLF